MTAERKTWMTERIWRTVRWFDALDQRQISQALRHRAADPTAPLVAFEAWGSDAAITYLIGADPSVVNTVAGELFDATVGRQDAVRRTLTLAAEIRINGHRRSALAVDRIEDAVRAVMNALASTGKGECAVIQVLLGPPLRPRRLSSSPSILQSLFGAESQTPSGEARALLKSKVYDHGFECTVRIGAQATSDAAAKLHLKAVLAALRTLESPGLAMSLKRVRPRKLQDVATPFRWPLRLNVAELVAFTAWPIGDAPLPGMPPYHPRVLPAPSFISRHGRVIGSGIDADGLARPVALTLTDSLQHLHVLGPTGTGKSTLLLNLAAQDIKQGHGVVVIDPKGDLVGELLERIPETRAQDVSFSIRPTACPWG